MYIHLGRDYVLNDRDVIGIFNLETTTISPAGGSFELRAEERRGGQPFGRTAPVLRAGRCTGGYRVSFGAVQHRDEKENGSAVLNGPAVKMSRRQNEINESGLPEAPALGSRHCSAMPEKQAIQI